MGYREKSPTSGTREKTREWRVLARLILLDTRDGELTRRLKGSLRKDDSDGNENREKATGLAWQNNNFARASRFFVYVHFLAVVARLRRESA